MDDARSNQQAVLRLTFPGSTRVGATPPPSLVDVAAFVDALEGLAQRYVREALGDNWPDDLQPRLVMTTAASGSLEVWVALIGVIGVTVTVLADGPKALNNLMLALQAFTREGKPALDVKASSSLPVGLVDSTRRQIETALQSMGETITRVDSVRITDGDLTVELTGVHFLQARKDGNTYTDSAMAERPSRSRILREDGGGAILREDGGAILLEDAAGPEGATDAQAAAPGDAEGRPGAGGTRRDLIPDQDGGLRRRFDYD